MHSTKLSPACSPDGQGDPLLGISEHLQTHVARDRYMDTKGPTTSADVGGGTTPVANTSCSDLDAPAVQHAPQSSMQRWLGVVVIALLNFMSAWSVIIYAPVADITRQHFELTSLSPVNWLYISCMFVYVGVSPISYLVTNRSTRIALILSAACLVAGSWLRYLGTRSTSYPCLLIGTILCGASQPFALNIPSHYSDLWFAPSKRVTPTALMSLANPLGQAFGTFIVPLLAVDQYTVQRMTLYVAVIFTASVWTVLLIGPRPLGISARLSGQPGLGKVESMAFLWHDSGFLCLLVPFACYVAAFNAFASLTQQLIQPHGFSDIQAGVIGASMIVVGLLCSGISAPIFDRTGAYKWPIRTCVGFAALSYFGVVFAIRQYSLGIFIAIILLAAVIGASSLILLPVVLDLATDVTRPVPPELGSTVLWTGGQGLAGICILIMDKLRTADNKYTHSMIFLVLLTMLPIPFAIALTSNTTVEERRRRARSTEYIS